MKISKIACSTLVSSIATINLYSGSSLDAIRNIQNQNQLYIESLEKTNEEGLNKKFEKQKEEIQEAEEEINAKIQEATGLKNAALKKQSDAEAEKQKTIVEKTASVEVKEGIEAAKQETEKDIFGENGKIKKLNDKVKEQSELKSILQDLDKDTFKGSKKNLKDAISVLKDDTDKLAKLSEDEEGNKNDEKIKILEALANIGLVKEDELEKLKKESNKQELTEKLNAIIGEDSDKGLRALKENIKKSEAEIEGKLEIIINSVDEIKKQNEEIKKQNEEIARKDEEINKQQTIIIEKSEKIKQAQQQIKELKQSVEQAEQNLKEAKELVRKFNDPVEKAKIIAELDAKIEEAKKDRAKSISKDESLKFNSN
ncbi:hypothetical protein, partial [Campylobacter pinnipediorum]|uniref:hypothetical protein n=1 Tax=Campylobacter pinnipediorum TaxID=1965231 RepID=UPI00112FAA5A